ncbi:MAG: aminotransferase class V-fold PLP-dependent enzyme [Chloroflexota bacterium]|nr:aminotransferase class V-fold PLP-dependent enzyme [Dehalococcoidia bacterium]MDW8255123.1 aminotransferase class V-fold PLP-dependent enzyme [Chloroflexota bacterium]
MTLTSDAAKLAAIREELPATTATVYLNAGTNGPLPRRAVQAMADWSEWELREGRVGPENLTRNLTIKQQLKEALAAFTNCAPEHLAITESTTSGVAAALGDFRFAPGDEIVTTDGEHGGVLIPLYFLERRSGVRVRLAPVGQRGGDITDAIASAATPRTRLVVVSHVSWSTGACYDIAALAAWCRERDLPLLVDGAQSVGAIPVDFAALDADYYAFSGQKWLLGPNGVGGLFVHPRRLAPRHPAGDRTLARYDDSVIMAGTRRFEIGGKVSAMAMAGSLAAVRWLLDDVGKEWLFERAGRLARRTAERLRAIPGVEVITPPEMGTMVCFRIGDGAQQDYLERCFAAGVRVRIVPEGGSPLDPQYLRLSVGFWNSDDDLDAAVSLVQQFAAA